jgi:hypothetical protein
MQAANLDTCRTLEKYIYIYIYIYQVLFRLKVNILRSDECMWFSLFTSTTVTAFPFRSPVSVQNSIYLIKYSTYTKVLIAQISSSRDDNDSVIERGGILYSWTSAENRLGALKNLEYRMSRVWYLVLILISRYQFVNIVSHFQEMWIFTQFIQEVFDLLRIFPPVKSLPNIKQAKFSNRSEASLYESDFSTVSS